MQSFVYEISGVYRQLAPQFNPDELEIELRILNGVDYHIFCTLLDNMNVPKHESESIVTNYVDGTRSIEYNVDGRRWVVYQRKTKLKTITAQLDARYALRCSFAQEIPTVLDGRKKSQLVRYKQTTHYYFEFEGTTLRFDFSTVRRDDSPTIFYEVELENAGMFSPNLMYKMMRVFYMVWNHRYNNLELEYSDSKKERPSINGKTYKPQMPVQFVKNKLLQLRKPYVFSWKYDGERALLMFNAKGVFILYRSNVIKQQTISALGALHEGTWIDCEVLSSGNIYCFDIVKSCGRTITHEPYQLRHDILSELLKTHILKPTLLKQPKVLIKPIYPSIEVLLQNPPADKRMEDGIIMSPQAQEWVPGTNKDMFKWKDRKHLTLDFRVKKNTLYMMDNTHEAFFSNKCKVPDTVVCGSIAEFRLGRDEVWKFVNTRPDKSKPNHRNTVQETMQAIQENISIQFLKNTL